MSKRKRKKKPVKKNKHSKRASGWWLIYLNAFALLLLALCGYLVWLDYKVTNAFEGKRWKLPARVYAKPEEIYIGMQYPQKKLIEALRARGYQEVKKVRSSGQFSYASNQVNLFSRKFAYWDRTEPERDLLIQWQGSMISNIEIKKNRQTIALFSLEPSIIGKIYPSHQEDRVLVSYDDVPPILIDALVTVEDRNFFLHHGFDPKGFIRALISNIKSGKLSQGGSTLTQQLVKNLILSNERSLIRKINELFMALLLERRYSKADIMSSYINEVYLGQDGAHEIHGFGTAAEFYFDRPLTELNTADIALLVGMVKGASLYNPRKNTDLTRERRNLVLKMLKDRMLISASQYQRFTKQPVDVIAKKSIRAYGYSHFLAVVKQQLLENYRMEDLRTEGLRVFTTMDKTLQDSMVKIARSSLSRIEKQKKLKPESLEVSAIISQVDTGEILALVGSRNSRSSDFNRAISASRPIGSLIKPFVYLNALSKPESYNPLTLINDIGIEIKQSDGTVWKPENYDHKEHGYIPLYRALSHSYNLATIQLGMELGLSSVINTLKKAGVRKKIEKYPSLLLGAIELTPIEVLEIYQPLASNGFKAPLKVIDSVLDRQSNPLKRQELEIRSIFKSSAVTVLNGVLSQVFTEGTARSVNNVFSETLPLAGKTGTSNDLRDSWFVGYGSNLLGVVWAGRDDNQNSGLSGASGALQIWAEMMPVDIMTPLTQNSFDKVKWLSVKHPDNQCDMPVRLPFYRSHLPKDEILCH